MPSWEHHILKDIKTADTFIRRPRGTCILDAVQIAVMKENIKWVVTLLSLYISFTLDLQYMSYIFKPHISYFK